ncbi:hypothetical protein [Nonomuraea salmonea]|uniref:hypothetical protein n=1 Tax=Nonomuraea salmonea TaxID=46181 RepID=UPI0031EC6DFD
MIDARGLGPGDLIGTMDHFRDLSGYGRATISEAARLLSDRGTVEIRPGRNGGLFVAAPQPDRPPPPHPALGPLAADDGGRRDCRTRLLGALDRPGRRPPPHKAGHHRPPPAPHGAQKSNS